MNKRRALIVLLLVCSLLLAGLAPAGASHRSRRVAGEWQYLPNPPQTFEIGSFAVLHVTDQEWWSGGLDGTSEGEYIVVIDSGGRWFFVETSSFEGSVLGRDGTMTMSVMGWRFDPTDDWFGRWTITGGTDGLEGITGHGIFWGPGYDPAQPDVPGSVDYTGRVRFSR